MPLIKCPDCEKEISDQAPTCPHCGRPSTHLATKKRHAEAKRYNQVSWMIFALALLSALAGAWAIAAVSLLAALVLSIIYHVKR